ncbi:MAG: hypothetical protein KJN71_06500, partial [Acidimicrobiia bacterium]|nr:hypothetical protein [Acidimicrobiia bacterium]
QYAGLADDAVDALERFFADVESGAFPADEETYHMPEETARSLMAPPSTEWADDLRADEAMER